MIDHKITHLAVCGDSFSVGHGLDPNIQFEKSFGGVVAEHFNLPHLVYGRSGCCNFVIYLQVKKIVEQTQKNKNFKPFVLLSDTWINRITFPIKKSWFSKSVDLTDVDYLNYAPYNKTYPVRRSLPFKAKKNFKFMSEGLVTLIDGKKHGLEQFYNKCKTENISPITAFLDEFYDEEIKKETDKCLIASAHMLLVKHRIPHLFLTQQLNELIDKEHNLESQWPKLAKKYPDPAETGHCSEKGHEIMANSVINHLEKYQLLS